MVDLCLKISKKVDKLYFVNLTDDKMISAGFAFLFLPDS